MGRPAGRINRDHPDKRHELATRLRGAMLGLGPGASVRELAEASGVSLGNLRHYFGDREGVFRAVAEVLEGDGRPYVEASMLPGEGTAEEVLGRYLHGLAVAWTRFGVGRIHAVTLAEGLGDKARGVAYVQHVLEPTLRSAEGLLAALVADGRLPPLDLRAGALALVGPVVLALLHQEELGGAGCRPLLVPLFIDTQLTAWLRGWAPAQGPDAAGRAGGGTPPGVPD